VNLAVDDGFVVGDPDQSPLRSPHNGHLTVLARSGVPGAILWLVLQCGFAVALVRCYLRVADTSRDWWGRVMLWILACWVTFVVNMTFEVSIEGPQGGIWFWSLFGFGIAVLEVQRRHDRAHPTSSAVPRRPWPARQISATPRPESVSR
jgi:O-antigen ligase